jgi:hypothetical protein
MLCPSQMGREAAQAAMALKSKGPLCVQKGPFLMKRQRVDWKARYFINDVSD